MKVFMIDIDNTICTTINNNYHTSKPITSRIKKINQLYDDGNIIIYWTNRGKESNTNWRRLTLEQLDRWGCKRNDVKFHKPYYDILIDSKSHNIDFLDKI